MGPSTTMRSTVNCASMRSAVHFASMRPPVWATVHFTTVKSAMATVVVAMHIMAMISLIATAPVIPSPAFRDETMLAPAVAIAPTGPRTYAQENSVIEVSPPVKSIRSATVGRSFVIAPTAYRWNADFYADTRTANADNNLRARCRHQGKTRKQCCGSE